MNELIFRQDAIDAMATWDWQEMYLPIHFKQLLENLPSAQQWIPCSERLPEKPKNYPHCENRRTWFLVSLESGCVESLAYDFDRDKWQITGSPVVAWMPLPEPWKGEKK